MLEENFAGTVRRQIYLGQNHGGDLLGREGLGLTKILDLDHRATIGVNDLEGPRLGILLDDGIVKAATDQTPVGTSRQHIDLNMGGKLGYKGSHT